MTATGSQAATRVTAGRFETSALFTCDNCGASSIAQVHTTSQPAWDNQAQDLVEYHWDGTDNIRWLPIRAIGHTYEDVPVHIAAAADEAHACFTVGAWRATVLLARAVIEATAKERGITTGTLAAKIDRMSDSGLLRAHIREAAHEVRYLGNEMAHGDFVAAVSEHDADETLNLMAEVLAEVYQSPARVERRRQARLAKESQPGAAPTETP